MVIPFKEGDRVRYIGNNTPFLKGLLGVVLEKSPQGHVRLSEYSYRGDSIPVDWDGVGYYGCYCYNLEFISHGEAEWEL